jgi:hypothetical protein
MLSDLQIHSTIFSETLPVCHIRKYEKIESELNEFSGANYSPSSYVPTFRGGQPTLMLQTPKVLEAAQFYYGCPSLAGVELEEWGTNGKAYQSHHIQNCRLPLVLLLM